MSYQCGDQVLDEFPADPIVLSECRPIYEEVEGWCCSTTQVRRVGDLPAKARHYVERIAALGRVPVSLVSVGPEREATIDNIG